MVDEIVLTPEIKKKFILFHNGRYAMKTIAEELGIKPDEANAIYMGQIGNIIAEFRNEYELSFREPESPPAPEPEYEEQPVTEPEQEEVAVEEEEQEQDELVEDDDDEIGETDDNEVPEELEEDEEEPEEEEEETVPQVNLPESVMEMLNTKPVIIESGEHAMFVAAKMTDAEEIPMLSDDEQAPDELPPLAIAPRSVILGIEQPFVYIRPLYNESTNEINTDIKEF